MKHTKSYRGNDASSRRRWKTITTRDDARLGGWQNYLRRSEDFTRFCCRLHIWEMLGAGWGRRNTSSVALVDRPIREQVVRQAFQPDPMTRSVRLESLTYASWESFAVSNDGLAGEVWNGNESGH